MKNKYITLLSVLVIGASSPLMAAADTIDNEINHTTNKIETLKGQKAEAEATLEALNTEVANLEAQVQETLDKKGELEQELNNLNTEITKLENAIEKRNVKIKEQARSAQVNTSSNSYLNVVIESDSISDAITRSWAYSKLVSANNDIMTAQQEDKQELADKKVVVDGKIVEVTALTEELKVKQEEMTAKQYDQAILAKEVAASLTTEESKKASLLKEKEEAEKRKAEAERLAKEQAKKEAEAAAKLAAEQKKRDEEAAKTSVAIAQEISTINTQVMPDDKDNQPANRPAQGSGDFQHPLPSLIMTSGYGNRPDPNGVSGNGHDGIDFAGNLNDPVYASRGGTVVSSGFDGSAGNYVIIQHDNGYYTYYLHLNSISVSGGTVGAGQVVGLMGTTGNSTGVHLHFGIATTGSWSGFVDPGPYLGLY